MAGMYGFPRIGNFTGGFGQTSTTGFFQPPTPGTVVGYRAPSLIDVLRQRYTPGAPSSSSKGAGFGTVTKTDAEGNVTSVAQTSPGERPSTPKQQNVIPPSKPGTVQGNKTTAVPPAPRPPVQNASAPPGPLLPPVPGGKPQERVSQETPSAIEPKPSKPAAEARPASRSLFELMPALLAPSGREVPDVPRAPDGFYSGAPSTRTPLPAPAAGADANPLARAMIGQPGAATLPRASQPPNPPALQGTPPVPLPQSPVAPGPDGIPGGPPIGPAKTGGFVQNQPMGFSQTKTTSNAMGVAQGRELALSMLKSRGMDDNRAGAVLGQVAGALQRNPNLSGDIGEALGIPELQGVTFDRLRMGARMAGIDLGAMAAQAAPPPVLQAPPQAAPAPPAAPPVVQASAPAAGDVQGWISNMAIPESGGNFAARNNMPGAGGTGHFGRLQFSRGRLDEAKRAGVIPASMTPEQFLANPQAQQAAEQWHVGDIDQHIRAKGYLDRGFSLDGLRAVAHLGGKGGMDKFVASGGKYNPADANGTRLSDYYARGSGKPQGATYSERIANKETPGSQPGGMPAGPPTPPTFEQMMAQTGGQRRGWSPPDLRGLAQAPIPQGQAVPLSSVIPAQSLDPLHASPGAMVQRNDDGTVTLSYSGEAARQLEAMWLKPNFDFAAEGAA